MQFTNSNSKTYILNLNKVHEGPNNQVCDVVHMLVCKNRVDRMLMIKLDIH